MPTVSEQLLTLLQNSKQINELDALANGADGMYLVIYNNTDSTTYRIDWSNLPSGSSVKNNDVATTAPTGANDASQGYSVLSQWADTTNDKVYICIDSTNGAAVWIDVSAGGSASQNINQVLTTGDTAVRDMNFGPQTTDLVRGLKSNIPASNLERSIGFGDGGEVVLKTKNTDTGGESSVVVDSSQNIVSTGKSFTFNNNEVVSNAGEWNASTNQPTLSNTDTNVKAIEYVVSVSGSVNFGAGSIFFNAGDIVSNNGTVWYKKVNNNRGLWVNLDDFGAVADNLGDTGFDSTSAWNNALDTIVANGGGILYVPYKAALRYNITPELGTSRQYTNVKILSFGKGGIHVKNTTAIGDPSRGNLIKVANGTDGLTLENLDIFVSEGTVSNSFENGVICQDALAGWQNISLKNVKIHTDVRPNTQVGVHGITFYRDTANAADTATCKNLSIKGCDVFLSGQNVYGFHTLRSIENIMIDGNIFELSANSGSSNDSANNAIAVYGDSKNFCITNNIVMGSGHSAIAASMAENGTISFNKIYNVSIVSEAGIEVEYKKGHGTNLTDPNFQTKSVKVIGNYVENCYWGIAVLTRELSMVSTDDVPPYDVLIQGNTCSLSTHSDLIVASHTSGAVDYTNGRIEGVSIDNNYFDSFCSESNIRIYDSGGVKITNNTLKNGNTNMQIGRTTDILPFGNFLISGNTFENPQAVASFRVQSMGANSYIDFSGNVLDGKSNGVIGVFANSLHESGVIYNIHDNVLDNFSDGVLMFSEQADIANSKLCNNIARNCTARGFRFSSDNGIAKDNIAINCVTNSNYGGAGVSVLDNKEL